MKLSLILDNIASRLGIAELNPMQKRVMESTSANTLLLSPTGSGKTIAFTIAMLRALGKPSGEVKAVTMMKHPHIIHRELTLE